MTLDTLAHLYVTTKLGVQVCDQAGRVVGEDEVVVTELTGGLRHLVDRTATVGPIRVTVGVDEPRTDDFSGRFDHALCRRAVETSNVDDAIPFNRDIRGVARIAGSVGDPAAPDQNVEHRS